MGQSPLGFLINVFFRQALDYSRFIALAEMIIGYEIVVGFLMGFLGSIPLNPLLFAALLGIGGGSATPERSAAFWKEGTPERRGAFWEALVAEMPATLQFTQRVLSRPIVEAPSLSFMHH